MPPEPEKNTIDLKDILLPKKEERTSASAERVNAGVLLEGEQAAELPHVEAAPIAPPPKKEGPVDSDAIAPLQTYESDVESVITQKNISGIDIVAAESRREGSAVVAQSDTVGGFILMMKIAGAGAGVALLLAAAGLLYFVFLRPPASVQMQLAAETPFIAVDDTQALIVRPDQLKRVTLMANLVDIKNKTKVSLGLMSRTYVAVSTSTVKDFLPPAIDAQMLLLTLAPAIPDTLLRSLDPSYYVLGTHVFDDNQPFLIIRADSYEQAFAGMLIWERTMQQELSPLFTRAVHPQLPTVTATATSSSSTPQQPTTQITPSAFQDRVVENHEARVIADDAGGILLLWTFVDRNTLVITTNEVTLRELISRRNSYIPGK